MHPPRGRRKLAGGLVDIKPTAEELIVCDRNAREAPILRLPAELRSLIWKFALAGDFVVFRDWRRKADRSRLDLLRVCRQVYAEATVLAYSINTFCFANDLNLKLIADDAKFRYIQKVRLRILGNDLVDGPDSFAVKCLKRCLRSVTTLELVLWYGCDMTAIMPKVERNARKAFGDKNLTMYHLIGQASSDLWWLCI